MSKTIKTSFDEKLTFENLLLAYDRARIGKNNNPEVVRFSINLESNIFKIYNSLKNGNYTMGKYREFNVYEPKERLIKSLPFKDRVVHQWYVYEFIKEYFYKRFIIDTYACIEGRGTHACVYKTQRYMKLMRKKYSDYYVLKCDVKKFFYSIDKNILFNIMKKYISDKKLLELTKIFIFDNDELKGIPIGNYTSQYFANIYLNELDHYIKDVLKVKFYTRYMDDFVLLVKDKVEGRYILENIRFFLFEELKLELNNKSNYYPNKKGINFCGYIIYEDYILLRKKSKIKIKNKIKKWNKSFLNDNLDNKHVLLSYNSYLGHSKHANSYNFNKKISEMFFFDI